MLAIVEDGGSSFAAPSATASVDIERIWADAYEHARPTLIRALAAATGSYDGVEDAIQEAVTDAIAKRHEDVQSREGWLFGAALNKLRGQRRRAAILGRLRLAPPSDRDELDEALTRIDVSRRLLALPARDRELLIAKHYIGMTQEEIARALNVPRGTISAAIARAAAKYRALERKR